MLLIIEHLLLHRVFRQLFPLLVINFIERSVLTLPSFRRVLLSLVLLIF